MNSNDSNITVGIDASNLRSGGGFNHLFQLLNATLSPPSEIKKVVVWTHKKMAEALPSKPWLVVKCPTDLSKSLLRRLFWQQVLLPIEMLKEQCDVLYSPGGLAPRFNKLPTVVMSRNMLPFEKKERCRYPLFSFQRLRLTLLKWSQGRSFSNATGLIFLSQYAQATTSPQLPRPPRDITTIPHGLSPRFFGTQRGSINLTLKDSIEIIYPSTIDLYKHQWNVVYAVKKLRETTGLNVKVSFAGTHYQPALQKLLEAMTIADPKGQFTKILGEVPFVNLHEHYAKYDLMVYASSCENLPNIILEAMAIGIPIVSSNRGPMPEVLGEGAIFFDPESVDELVASLKTAIFDSDFRSKASQIGFERAKLYDWTTCSQKTFSFIRDVTTKHKQSRGGKSL